MKQLIIVLFVLALFIPHTAHADYMAHRTGDSRKSCRNRLQRTRILAVAHEGHSR